MRIIVKNDHKSKKNDIINLIYPITNTNTLSLEVKKNENKIEIKRNILKLKKRNGCFK